MKRSLLLAILMLAGCGASPSRPHPAAPAGFARYDAAGVSFDRPSAWTREQPEPGLISYYGRPGEGGLPPQVGLGSAPARNDLRDAVAFHKDTQKIRHPDYTVRADRDAEVAGAAAARLVDAEYTLTKPGSAVRVREVNVLVLTQDGRQLDFFVRAPVRDYAPAELDAVLASLRLR
jgi:hypothetical protein